MSRELEDLTDPIAGLQDAIDGLRLLGASQGVEGNDTQVGLYFVANVLEHIHSDLEKKYTALEAVEQGNAPVPLHGA